jgi:glycosyltransferase involved in cell wall biosynthesis
MVVGISRHILNQHLSRGYFGRTQMHKVIYNAYPKKTASRPDDFGEDKPFRLGFLGQLKPSKGIQLLLQAVAELPGNDYELRIGGKGPEKYVDYLKTRYKSPNIYFLEFVDPDIFFSNIDLLVVPSLWHEPLGRTILEAYAHGVPVIGSNRGGIPELIDIGKTGYVFNPDHPDSVISLIDKIKQNPDLLVRMQNSAINKSQAFLPERSLSEYITTYQDAMRLEKNRQNRDYV